ncbi:MAG: aldehyde dehydrogenase family protein [Planctomycetota bacterium]
MSEASKLALARWQALSHDQRCKAVASTRHQITRIADKLIEACRSPQRTEDLETVASELIPLCDALHWLGRRGSRVLASRKVGWVGRPLWLWGSHAIVQRRPLGTVLVLGAWNYPLLLVGVQAAQALAGGNRVLIKPPPGCESATELLASCFHNALADHDIDPSIVQVIDSSVAEAQRVMANGIDCVVLTGGIETGVAVMQQAAKTITPSIMELSGSDAVVSLNGSLQDVKLADRLVRCLEFGLLFNSGATCIGPRRWFVPKSSQATKQIIPKLITRLQDAGPVSVHASARQAVADLVQSAINPPMNHAAATDLIGRWDVNRLRYEGLMHPVVLDNVPEDHAILQSDLFAPVLSIVSYEKIDEVIDAINTCRYRLSASVFGDRVEAERVANRLDVGTGPAPSTAYAQTDKPAMRPADMRH